MSVNLVRSLRGGFVLGLEDYKGPKSPKKGERGMKASTRQWIFLAIMATMLISTTCIAGDKPDQEQTVEQKDPRDFLQPFDQLNMKRSNILAQILVKEKEIEVLEERLKVNETRIRVRQEEERNIRQYEEELRRQEEVESE